MKRFAVACMIAGLGMIASGCHNQAGPQNAPPQAQTAPAATAPLTPLPSSATPTQVAVYVLNPKATTEETTLISREVPVKHPQTPVADAMNALLHSSESPVVPGTALRGLSVDSGIATLDFSRNPVNETGGEDAQSTALKAIAMTLGQFPEINQYRIKVQGEDVRAFGEFSTDGPVDVIRAGDTLEAKGRP